MKFSKKMLSVILAIAMLLSCVTVAFSASAEGEVNYKVVIDSTGTLVDGSVDANGYTLKVVNLVYYSEESALYDNNIPGAKALDSAIGKYIELYGVDTDAVIYISGNLFTYQFLASYNAGERPFDKTAQLNSLRIEGYNGTSDTFYTEDLEKLNNLYCDLTIDNITFKTKGDGIGSGLGTLTIGKNANASATYIGAHPTYVKGDVNLVINSGSYSSVYALDSQGGDTVNANVNFTFNGGNFSDIRTLSGASCLNGNLKFTFNGGNYSAYIFAASRTNSKVLGNNIFEVNGGDYSGIANSDVRVFNIQPGSAVSDSGNLAIILNSHNTTGKNITVYDNGQTSYAEGKKEIVVINNAQNNLFGFDHTLRSDYLLKVSNGKAYPKFSETENPADSVLLGFEISYEDEKLNDIYTPYIGDTSLADYYDEETGLYDLSSFEVSGGMAYNAPLNVTFKFSGGTKVVVDTTGELTDGTIVDGTMLKVITTTAYTGNYTNDNTPHMNAIKSAVSALVALGEINPTLYVNGNVYTYSYKDAFASASGFESLTIEGYNGTEDIFTLEDSEKIWTSCDMIFDNVTLKAKGGPVDAMYSNGYTVTFGEGVSLDSTTNIGIEKGSAGSTARENNIVISGGKYNYIGGITNGNINNNTSGDVTLNSNYVFNAGSFGGIWAGVYSCTNNNGGNWAINGNVYYEFNGGEYNSAILVNSSGAQPITGNTIFVVNGGDYNLWDSNANRRDPRAFNIQAGYLAGTIEGNGNIAIIFNSWEDTKETTVYNNGSVHLADGKKSIAVINNAQIGKQGFDGSLDNNPLDYMIKVNNGKAMPVFSEASNSVLEGFTITPNEGYEDCLVMVNGSDLITADNGLYDLSAYEDFGAIQIEFLDAKELEATTDEVTEQEFAEYKSSGDYPTKDGFLFAGWYADASSETAMTANQFLAAESAVAKFIPKAVLSIGWQIAKGENGTANLRLISTVDSLQYSGVRFTLKCEGRADMVLESKTVYTGIVGYVNGNKQDYVPTDFSSASQYFMTHIVKGIPDSYHKVDFIVEAALITKDGKVITGDPIKFQLADATDYNEIIGNK